jgi:4-amino-4-deoxy-L-arabinose transferase-like glycosyltransferase
VFKQENIKYYNLIGLIVLIYLVIFVKLDSFHMRWWDESMFAVNAYEMLHNGKYFSLYFDGLPDLFNTKPPLSIWIQLLFIKILGYNELALRLPSAIAAGLSVLMIFNFIEKRYSVLWAWISALILLTSFGFNNFHTARTADADSLLCFFLLAANLYFIKYLLESKRRDILFFLVFISLGFATKMYAAVLFSPAYLVILFREKKIKDFILNKQFIIGAAILLSSAIGFILLREHDTPGYIQQVLFKDAGRIFNVVESHSGSLTFYLDNFITTRFSIWFVLFIGGCIIPFFIENKTEKHLVINFLILTGFYLMIVSCSVTKLEWYDMPLYPIISVIAAYPLYLLLRNSVNQEKSNSTKQTILIVTVLFFYPYYVMFDKSQGNTIPNGEKQLEANERYIFTGIREKKNFDGIKVYHSGYTGSLIFYRYKLLALGQNIDLKLDGEFNINDRVLVSNDSLINELKNRYHFLILDKFEQAQLVQIDQIR